MPATVDPRVAQALARAREVAATLEEDDLGEIDEEVAEDEIDEEIDDDDLLDLEDQDEDDDDTVWDLDEE